MIERIVKVVCFAIVAVFFAILGGVALYALNYDLSPSAKASRVRSAIEQLKDMGPRIEAFRQSEKRLPPAAKWPAV